MAALRLLIPTAAGLAAAAVMLLDFRPRAERALEDDLLAGRIAQLLDEAHETLESAPSDRFAHEKRVLANLALPTPDAPSLAASAVRDMEKAGVPTEILNRALGYAMGRVRRNAAYCIGLLGASEARTALERRVQDPSPDVRVAVVEALGRLGEPQSFFSLALALRDGEWQVRAEAAAALGRLGEAAAVPHLLHTVADPDGYVRYQSMQALLKFAEERRAGLFRSQLDHTAGTPAELVLQLALAKCGEPGAFDRVATLLEKAPAVDRADVLRMLAQIDASRARALFEKLISNEADQEALAFMETHLGASSPNVE